MNQFLLVSILLGVLGCNLKTGSGKEESGAVVDDSELVDAFLRLRFPKETSAGVTLVIKQKLSSGLMTPDEKSPDYAAKFIGEAKRRDLRLAEAVSNFLLQNEGNNTVESIGRLSTKHVIMTDTMQEELFKDGWENYRKAFPGSPPYMTLSRPGFSKDGSLAILYMGQSSPYLSAGGRFYILEREKGHWVEVTKWRIGPEWKS